MSHPLDGIDDKLKRAEAHINHLYGLVEAFIDSEPYTVRVDEEPQSGNKFIGRFVAIKNHNVKPPHPSLVLLAGETLYQLRSALDHLIHQLVILNGQGAKLQNSRAHQFPIFDTPEGYAARASGKIDGVSQSVAALIEGEQPYKRQPNTPHNDPLWILQDLNNTDKHRVIPTTVIGIGVVDADDTHGRLFTVQSPDIVLEDEEVFFSFVGDPNRHRDIHAKLTCSIAFQQAMSPFGSTLGIDAVLLNIASRAHDVVGLFRPLFPD